MEINGGKMEVNGGNIEVKLRQNGGQPRRRLIFRKEHYPCGVHVEAVQRVRDDTA